MKAYDYVFMVRGRYGQKEPAEHYASEISDRKWAPKKRPEARSFLPIKTAGT